MACMKLGSKADAFKRQGQAWFCTTGLPSDVTVEVGEMSFHLHKFPLLSRCGMMERLIGEASEINEGCLIQLHGIPGGVKAFELVVRFCYGVKLELTVANVAYLRCAAEYLEMTEDYGEGNLIAQTESFLSQVVLHSWKDLIKTLRTCDDVIAEAEDLHIVKRCIESIAIKACTEPNLFGWPMMENGLMQSPGGSVLWNGISTGARPRSYRTPDWWYEDVLCLSFSTYKRLILAMETQGVRMETIAGSLEYYARRYLPGLNRRHYAGELTNRIASMDLTSVPSEEDQKILLEEIEGLLPMEKGLSTTKFLFGMLRTAMILHSSPSSILNLEKRIGVQLDQATLEDLLLPNFSYTMETLYNVDCVQRILEHFLAMDQATTCASPCLADDDRMIGSPSLTPITTVAKLIDGFLAEVAPDVNLKLSKFQSLAAAIPDFARPLDDGLYRAVDIYLKAHPWLTESEREHLCRLIDCQKLSIEACTHAAQNERLPLRVVVQVLFFEQLQLRSSIAGCLLVSDNLDASRQLRSGVVSNEVGGNGWTAAVRENQVLKVGMDNMRMRVAELERECSSMKREIEKLGKARGGWSSVPMKLGFKMKSQMCSVQESEGSDGRNPSKKAETLQTKLSKPRKNLHANG